MVESSIEVRKSVRGRWFALVGFCLAVLGVAGYVVQIRLQRLTTPWYMPALSSFGLILVIVSLIERRTIARILALAVVMMLAVAEWGMLYAMRLPPYSGPITVGRPFPAFETKRADGTAFTQADLASDRNHVLVFFRGRW